MAVQRKEDNDDTSSESESESSVTTEEEEEEEEETEGGNPQSPTPTKSPSRTVEIVQKHPYRDGSRLFQPHRTVGMISSTQPFHLSSHSGSGTYVDAFVTMPLEERFVVYKCDTLKTVLVSDSLPSTRKGQQGLENKRAAGEKMYHAISDQSMQVTIATHAHKGKCKATHATLYKRTMPISTINIVKRGWGISHVLNLGKSKLSVGEKMENCMLVAIICSRDSSPGKVNANDDDDDDIVEVGESDSEDDDDDNDDTDSSSSDEEESSVESDEEMDCNGEVVIVVVSRRELYIKKRISLQSVPNFCPSISLHPHTYLNKILIGSSVGGIILLNVHSNKIIHQFKCLRKEKASAITAIEQSPAVDTVAVGNASGNVHIINIRMDVKLFTLYHEAPRIRGGNEVRCLSFRTDSLALDHSIAPLAVGQLDGTISVWDLTPRTDMDDDFDDEFTHKETANSVTRRTLLCQMKNIHKGGVCSMTFLPQEPLLLSSGLKSNSLLMHIFDNPNHSGRILRQRIGHTSPPTLIRYQHSSNGGVLASMADGTDAASCNILSCGGKGDQSLRVFSTARFQLDREYSQGKGLTKRARDLNLKDGKVDLLLKEVAGMAISNVRTRDWGDLVTIHKDHAFAYVWSSKTKSQSGPVLRQEEWNVSAMKKQPPKSAHATAVAISACGHFAVIGTRSGIIYKYNLQSGLARGSFPRNATSKAEDRRQSNIAGNIKRTTKMLERGLKIYKLHEKEQDPHVIQSQKRLNTKMQNARHKDSTVVGLAIDSMNKTLISVGSDSKLILWSFSTHAPHKKCPINLKSPAKKMIHTRDSDFLAISLEDFSIIMFDCSSLSIVRQFGVEGSMTKHTAPISDMAFGPDGRRLFSSSLDGTIRVWDVPTNTCVDWMTFSTPPTALSLSCTGEFMATSHQGRLGISLWCDRSFFQTIHIDGASPLTEPFQMDEPISMTEDFGQSKTLTIKVKNEASPVELVGKDGVHERENIFNDTEDPKAFGLITLSKLPPAHWKNLFHLELVKQRNKPVEAPKKPPSAPFFLQWTNGDMKKNENVMTNSNSEDKELDKWDAAWSDNENEENLAEEHLMKRKITEGNTEVSSNVSPATQVQNKSKRKKVVHFRSDLVGILEKCSLSNSDTNTFTPVTELLSTMGPSAIDVAFSSLCHGMHDLDDGLHFLYLASSWLLEAVESRQNFEVINTYLHRFLHIHGATISGIDTIAIDSTETNVNINVANQFQDQRRELLVIIARLKKVQREATEHLQNKIQRSLCVLAHLSRMV